MKKTILIIAAAVVVLGVAAYFIAKSVQNNTATPTTKTETPTTNEQDLKTSIQPVANPEIAAQTHTVIIQDFAFSPATITINQGDTMVWANKDSAPHAISGDGFESPSFKNGQDYSFKFTETGTFNYICSLHPSMKGIIIVK